MNDEQPSPPPFWIRHIIHKEELLLVFSASTDMLTFNADQAREIGSKLLEFADSVKPRGKMQ